MPWKRIPGNGVLPLNYYSRFKTHLKMISKTYTILAYGLTLLIFSTHYLFSQSLNVSISPSGFAANSCTRTLTANVSNGSGNYSYQWSLTAPGVPFPGSDNTRSVSVALNVTTDFIVHVRDVSTGATGSSSVTVPRVLLGDYDFFTPNIFTPNGDDINDTWFVADADKGFGAINAYRYELSISNTNGISVFSKSETITVGNIGLKGGDIEWNGRVNGTGSIVPNGTYTYRLRLYNCSGNQLIQGFIQVFGNFNIVVSPNPATKNISIEFISDAKELTEENSVPYSINIFNYHQKLVKNIEMSPSKNLNINVDGWRRGNYVMQIMINDKLHISRFMLE